MSTEFTTEQISKIKTGIAEQLNLPIVPLHIDPDQVEELGIANKIKSNLTPKKHGTLNTVQRACLRYILENPACHRWQLGGAINRGYAPDVVQYIRQKGIKINTVQRKVEWKKRPIGFYSVASESKAKAWQMIGGEQ